MFLGKQQIRQDSEFEHDRLEVADISTADLTVQASERARALSQRGSPSIARSSNTRPVLLRLTSFAHDDLEL